MTSQSRNVLLIAMNPEASQSIQALLGVREGPSFGLRCIDSLAKGLECLAAGGIDVVLLDLDLPESQLLNSLSRIQEQAPGVPVVVLTGSADEALAVKAVQQGAQDCLVKGQTDGQTLGRSLSLAIERCRRQQAERKARVRLPEANSLASEILANAAHELRSPLNGIIGFADLMHNEMAGPISPTCKEFLGDILTCGRHLLQLISDILTLSRIETEPHEFCPEPVDPAKSVSAVRDLLRSLAARKRVWIDVRIDPGLGRIVVDPDRFKEVLYRYLSSALTLAPGEGRVTVCIRPEGPEAFRLDVTITGRGIRSVDVEGLFGVFPPSEAGSPCEGPGAGPRLSLAKRLVESQGGRVGGQSLDGQGVSFFAVLPRVTETTSAGCNGPSSKPIDPRTQHNVVAGSLGGTPGSRGSPA